MSAGLQAERTELAWRRTALSCWAVALLATKIDFPYGAAALAGPVALSAVAFARRRHLHSAGAPPALSRIQAAFIAVACVILAGASMPR